MSIFKGNDHSTNAEIQLKNWVDGKPLHNDEQDECCPDFSCCQPNLLRPEGERKAFVEADTDTRMQMLMGYLGDAFAEAGIDNVHIAGDKANYEEEQ